MVTDSVFSMDGDIAPLSAICDAVDEYGAWRWSTRRTRQGCSVIAAVASCNVRG